MEDWMQMPQGDEIPENNLFEEINEVLSFSSKRDEEVLHSFGKKCKICNQLPEPSSRRFSGNDVNVSEIEHLAVPNRLRFLPSHCFNGSIPYEVISRIKKLEHRMDNKLSGLMILASQRTFHEKGKKGYGAIFMTNSNGTYSLLYAWGKEPGILRKSLTFPFKNLNTMLISAITISVFLSALLGWMGFFTHEKFFQSILYKLPIIVLISGFLATCGICAGLLTYTEFSEDQWKSDLAYGKE